MNLIMDLSRGYVGLGVVLIFFIIIIISLVSLRNKDLDQVKDNLRDIASFRNLKRSINVAVETGANIHISLGWGSISSRFSASSLVALSVLRKIIQRTPWSDTSPLSTSGDGTLVILSQDTTQNTYKEINLNDKADSLSSQLSGATPWAIAAGTLPGIFDQTNAANIIIGHFGIESALISDASEKEGDNVTFSGSDDLTAQSVLFTTSSDPLIGEEIFASGAYTRAGTIHLASLRAQDIMRWLIILVILISITLKAMGIV